MRPIILLLSFLVLSPALAQQKKSPKLDSLRAVLYSEKHSSGRDTNTVKLLCQIAAEYRTYPDSSTRYAFEGLKIAEQLKYEYGKGICFAQLALINWNTFEISLDYYLRALKIFERQKRDADIAEALWRIGGLYFNMEKFRQALDYFTKAQQYYLMLHDETGVARTHQSVAAAYIDLQNYTQALSHEFPALKYFEEKADMYEVAKACGNIAECYAGLREYNKALPFSARATRILAAKYKGADDYPYAMALSGRGYIHFLIATDSGTAIQPDSLLPAGKEANLAKAIEYYTAAYTAFMKAPHFVFPDILKRLAAAWELAGNYELALKSFKRSVVVRDSMLSLNTRLNIAAMETRREAELKERAIEINRIRASNENKERWLFALIVGLLGIVLALIWRDYNKQKLANAGMLNALGQLETEKDHSDKLAADLKETIVLKDELTERLYNEAEMKAKFLANISHELRTPITVLNGMLELMHNGEGDAALVRNNLSIAYSNSRRLQYMVEEILDLSRLDTTEMKMANSVKELGPILKGMVYTFETFIAKEGLVLTYTDTNTSGTYVSVDEKMLGKVVNNLVYNAIKFNETGGWIRVNAMVTGGDKFVFSVGNSGARIRPEDLPHIFDRYYQGNSSAGKGDGVGIGLALVKEFTLLMGGRVYVESHDEKGTTFTLEFPLADGLPEHGNDATMEELPATVWEHFPEKQTVLLVEDNDEMRYYLRAVLGQAVNVAEAINGKKALEWLAANRADLVISDMMMPEMDGAELVKNLKDSPLYRKIPVITLTALADGSTRLSMLRLGIDDYIVKPFNAEELRVRVYNLLSNQQERRTFEQKPAEPDDITMAGAEAEKFRSRLTDFVLARIKTINVSVYDLAYELNMSERQLYRLAKKLTGCTPAQLIKEVKLQRAYELLQAGNIFKLDDIAGQVGFEDSNYFARQFYQRFGKRATDFF